MGSWVHRLGVSSTVLVVELMVAVVLGLLGRLGMLLGLLNS